jgi:hypothetical protein
VESCGVLGNAHQIPSLLNRSAASLAR